MLAKSPSPPLFEGPSQIPSIPLSKAGGLTELEADNIVRRLRHTRTPLLNVGSELSKKSELLKYFQNTWEISEKLFAVLKPVAYYRRADRLRHPLIFYFGHVAGFYVNKLRLAKLMKARVNKKFEALFAVGVDEMSWDDLLPDSFQWPSIEDVTLYRNEVRARVEQAILSNELKMPIDWDNPYWAVVMGCEHERIHLETSSVLIRQLPINILNGSSPFLQKFWNVCPTFNAQSAPENELIVAAAQTTTRTLGKSINDPLYGWDNEYGTHEHVVHPFKASKFLVSNREFLEFIEKGGYDDEKLWTDEGWRWVNFRKPRHPLFWVEVVELPAIQPEASGDQFLLRVEPNTFEIRETDVKLHAALFEKFASQPLKSIVYLRSFSPQGYYYQVHEGPRPNSQFLFRNMMNLSEMPWDWPIEVNNLEAKAFCNFLAQKTGKKIRLPTEEEYYVLNSQISEDQPYWRSAPGNINLEHFCSSTPVDFFPPTREGFYDVIGNVWQHTETPIDPYQGFRVHQIYEDFSLPTFDLKHNLMKGGSWISTGNEAIKDSRYAFRRHFFQHCGIRYVESEAPVVIRPDTYERDTMLSLYSDSHFNDSYFGVTNFPEAAAKFALKFFDANSKRTAGRALDLGCGVGRTTFELARTFNHVCGLDFSARFIRSAVQLKEQKSFEYQIAAEGDSIENKRVTLQDLKLNDEITNRTVFFQSDACNLDPRYSNYDLVVCFNVLEYLYDPRVFLQMIHERINENGIFILGSTYDWNESFTPKDYWLSGTPTKPSKALDSIRSILSSNFRQIDETVSLPFILRHNSRKFEHNLCEVTVWEKI